MNITCAIIDDEPLARELLESYVSKTPFLTLQGSYASAIEAWGNISTQPVDLIFLDIQMPELSGLEFSKVIPVKTRFIFTTAFSQYALDGYKVNALDYLLKPISYSDFLAAAQKALSWFEKTTQAAPTDESSTEKDTPADAFFVKSDYKVVRVRFDEVLYVEGLKDYVKIYLTTSPKPLLSLSSMHAVEEHLPKHPFMRIHRSFIVNMNHVEMLERGQIVIGEKHLPISDSYKDSVQCYIRKHMLQGRI